MLSFQFKYSVCFFIALLFQSCNNDELEKNRENAKVAKTDLKLEKFSNPNIAKNVEADFENVNEIEKDNFEISEISAKEKVVNDFQSDLLQSQLKYQGVTIKYEGKSYSYFFEVYALKKSTFYPETITKLKDFSGTLNVYSFAGKNLGSVGVIKGTARNISDNEELDILTKAINLFSVSSNTTNRIPPCNTPYYQPMQFTIYWHTEVIVNNVVISYVLSNVTTETIMVETSYPCDALPQEVARAYRYEIIGRSGIGGSGTTPPQIKPQIIDNLTGKAKCLNDLLNKNGNSFVQNLFSKFEGTSKFDIVISSVDALPKTVDGVVTYLNGRTLKPNGKLIQIEISSTEANKRAPLEVARIILHEYIHADIYRKLGTVLATNVENLDFKTTYEKYEGEQHSVMATLYVQSMQEALKQFHQSLFPGDIKAYTDYYNEPPSDAFYEALAWGGLRDENVKAWNDLPDAKKASIEALASRVEQFSKTSPCSN